MIPFLNEGRGGLARLHAEAAKLGLVFNADQVKTADEFGDALDRAAAAARGTATAIGLQLAPAATSFLKTLGELIELERQSAGNIWEKLFGKAPKEIRVPFSLEPTKADAPSKEDAERARALEIAESQRLAAEAMAVHQGIAESLSQTLMDQATPYDVLIAKQLELERVQRAGVISTDQLAKASQMANAAMIASYAGMVGSVTGALANLFQKN